MRVNALSLYDDESNHDNYQSVYLLDPMHNPNIMAWRVFFLLFRILLV